jgi:O-antigen/teichoic acid export membrane protein
MNATWLVGTTTLNKVIALATFVIVARVAGPHVTGTYFYGLSVTSIFVILSDLGMTPVLIRAVASGREDTGALFGAVWRLKALLSPIAILAALGYGVLNGLDPVTMQTIAIACLVMTADTVSLALYGVLRGKQDLRPESVGMFLGQVITATFAIFAAMTGGGSVGLVAALLAGSSWNVLWSFLKVRSAKIVLARPVMSDYRRLLIEAMPFGISGIAVKLYSYVDTLMIRAYHGTVAVGMYAVAYKMTYALQFLPLTFTAALYPAFASAWSEKKHDELTKTFLGSLRLMAFFGFALSGALSALAGEIIPLIYGRTYLGAVVPFQILPWVLLPIFLDFPIGSLLNATHRAHLKTSAMVGTMLVNVLLNAALVPSMGAVGAAWASVFSFWFLFLIGVVFTKKDIGGIWVFARIISRAVCAAGVLWYVTTATEHAMPFIAHLIFSGSIALICAFISRLISVDDLRFISRIRPKQMHLPQSKEELEEGVEGDIHAES